jgi:hypothetical protein
VASDLGFPPDNAGQAQPLSIDDDKKLDQFVEAVAASALQRQGIGEFETLELVQTVLGVDRWPQTWAVLRAWVEAGYIDSFIRRKWRGRVYFARRPRLVVINDSEGPRVVLHGLAPGRLRALARSKFAALGAINLEGRTFCPFIGSPQAWRIDSATLADMVAKELELGPVSYVRSLKEIAIPLAAIVAEPYTHHPGYELQGTWNWERGGFHGRNREAPGGGVGIEWHVRLDRPDLFRIVVDHQIQWQTFSRNWALLIGYTKAKRRTFVPRPPNVIGKTLDGPYVPLPLARAICLQSNVIGGPTNTETDYAYQFDRSDQRAWFLGWIEGPFSGDVLKRLNWIYGVARATEPFGEKVGIPPNLQRQLKMLSDVPFARQLAQISIPKSLLPHLRLALRGVG